MFSGLQVKEEEGNAIPTPANVRDPEDPIEKAKQQARQSLRNKNKKKKNEKEQKSGGGSLFSGLQVNSPASFKAQPSTVKGFYNKIIF